MPTLHEIARLFAYNRWANNRTLESVSGLTPELDRTLGGRFPSVRATLEYIRGARGRAAPGGRILPRLRRSIGRGARV